MQLKNQTIPFSFSDNRWERYCYAKFSLAKERGEEIFSIREDDQVSDERIGQPVFGEIQAREQGDSSNIDKSLSQDGEDRQLHYIGGITGKRDKWLDDGKSYSRNFSQGQRVYASDGIATTLASNAGGQGGKTGLYMIDDPSRNKGIVDKNIAPTLRAESHGNLPSVVTDSFVALTERRTNEAKELRKMGVTKDTRSLKELTPRDDNLANTLTTGDVKNSSLTDGKRIRRLTPTECERLQGFPSMFDWTNRKTHGTIGDMTRDELISIALATKTIKVDAEKGKVYVLRGPGGIWLEEPRECGTECNGYLVANLSANGVKKQVRLHRVIWISVNGIPLDGLDVCHKDDNKKHNWIDNLYLATSEQNTQDAARNGLLNGRNTKIDFEIATNIRMNYITENITMRELAERYKISKSRIQQIIRMEGWTEKEGISDTQRYKQCGNAVTVNVVSEIAKRMF